MIWMMSGGEIPSWCSVPGNFVLSTGNDYTSIATVLNRADQQGIWDIIWEKSKDRKRCGFGDRMKTSPCRGKNFFVNVFQPQSASSIILTTSQSPTEALSIINTMGFDSVITSGAGTVTCITSDSSPAVIYSGFSCVVTSCHSVVYFN